MRLQLRPVRGARSLFPAILVSPSLRAGPHAAGAEPAVHGGRLVGTWERVSLLRNALSVQPPDAPLFVKFGADGYWSMMEMPDDRPKIAKPPDQMTAKELFDPFRQSRRRPGDLDGQGRRQRRDAAASRQHRAGRREQQPGSIVLVRGRDSRAGRHRRQPITAGAVQAAARAAGKPHPLVGTWERTSHAVDGKPSPQPAPLVAHPRRGRLVSRRRNCRPAENPLASRWSNSPSTTT